MSDVLEWLLAHVTWVVSRYASS